MTCIMNEVILFVHQQHGEFERVAGLGAPDAFVLRTQSFEEWLGPFRRRAGRSERLR